MKAMLLAAGKSTRLGTLGARLPKPLVPICGYPAIEFGLALCGRAGLRDVVVNVHHHADLVRQAVGDGARLGLSVQYSVEDDELLGTGGGIARARKLLGEGPVLVMNAKVVAEVDLAAVIAAHRSAPAGTVATMVLRDDPRPEQWSTVGVDAIGRVVSLRGKRGLFTTVGDLAARMFTGIHVLEPRLIDRLPPGVSDLIADAYIPALLDEQRIHSVTLDGFFADPSTPERYLETNLALLRDPAQLAHPPGPLTGVDPAAQVAPGATIVPPVRLAAGAVVEAGAVVGPEVVVCAGGRVAAGARVERTVVWGGGVARDVAAGAVLAPEIP